VGKPDENRQFGRIILKWLLKKFVGRAWAEQIWFRMGTGGGLW
jgi:hypothetical protein